MASGLLKPHFNAQKTRLGRGVKNVNEAARNVQLKLQDETDATNKSFVGVHTIKGGGGGGGVEVAGRVW